MTAEAGSGHYMSSLSSVEILVALYFEELRHFPKDPCHPDRDRFLLGKGHTAPALYAVMAESGYFLVEELMTLRKMESRLQGHPISHRLPGLDSSSGSLGQAFSVGVGIALAGKLDKKDYKVYIMLGDGELQEGQVWEAAMSCAHFGLDNVIAIVDRNRLQCDGDTEDIMALEPLRSKWEAFGWRVFDVDGHDLDSLLEVLKKARVVRGQPTVIIANTVKGKGVPLIEGNLKYHSAPLSPDELKKALEHIK